MAKKNKKLASQFPNIYRFITENKSLQKLEKSLFRLLNQAKTHKSLRLVFEILFFLVMLTLILTAFVFTVSLYKNIALYDQTSSQRQQLQSEINFWESIASKYDGYKDAYFRIALLEYRLGNIQKSNEFNRKALLLDPNYEDAKKLEEVINK